jgi:hypothetical protein
MQAVNGNFTVKALESLNPDRLREELASLPINGMGWAGFDRVSDREMAPFPEATWVIGVRSGLLAEGLEQPVGVVPRDPGERGELDGVDALPGAATPDDLRLVQADHGLGQRVVTRIASAPDRRPDAGGGQPLRVANRQVLHAAIAVVN